MDKKAGSSVKRPKRPARGEMVNGCKIARRDPEDGEPNRTVFFGMIPIQVWLNSNEGRISVRKAYFPNCRIPYGQFFIHNNFLIRHANLEGIKLVAFVSDDSSLMGVNTAESMTSK